MVKRPTIQDLARESGLGVATVDRVLHGRANVSDRAILRVTAAAERLGYHATGAIPSQRKARRQRLRFGFVLHKQGQEFYQRFARMIF